MHVERAPLGVIRWSPRFVVEEWTTRPNGSLGHDRAEAIGARAGALLGAGVDDDGAWTAVVDSTDGIALSLEHVAKGGGASYATGTTRRSSNRTGGRLASRRSPTTSPSGAPSSE